MDIAVPHRPQQLLHRRREGIEVDDLRHHLIDLFTRERFEVRDEIHITPREVCFGLLVEPAMNGIVGPLEEAVFAVLRELEAGLRVIRMRERHGASRRCPRDICFR